MLDVAIIGGGLSGLSLAQRLLTANRSFAVFESRDRFGGRILSLPASHSENDSDIQGDRPFRYDLGAGWIWPDFQPRIADFIMQHTLETNPQRSNGLTLFQSERDSPPQTYIDLTSHESARRINGGAYRLVEALLTQLPTETLKLNHHLQAIIDLDDHVELHFKLETASHTVKAKQVVMTASPRLLTETVSFQPELDPRFKELMNATATWMAGHAKALIRYPRAFWREAGFSGNALANYRGAALAEIFDASSPNGDFAALSGFLALPAALRKQYRNDLEAMIIDQLVNLFGTEAAQPDAIHIQDWFEEPLTATPADEILPQSHPRYGHAWFQLDHWNDKLYFSGTETARQFGGYLEGALESTERVAKDLLM